MSGSATDLSVKIGVEGLPQLQSAFEKVEERLNTVAGRQRQYEQSTLLVQRAQEAGIVSTDRASQAMAVLQSRFEAQTREVNQASAAFASLNGSLTSAAGHLGSAGAALSTMGPAGLAAAAAAGTLSLGMTRVAAAGDEMTSSLGRVRAAAGSMEAAEAVYGRLYQISLQTGQSVAESAGQFSRFAIAAREIGATNSQALELVDTLQKAAIVGGASMAEAASAATQLAQALASGRLNGDELGSLLENMPNLAVALARELGTSVGELRKLGEAGELTADRVFPALLRAGADLNAEYEKMPVTMSRAFDQLQVASGNFLGRLDQALGLSQALARSLSNAATAMDAFSARATPTAEAAAARNSSARGDTVRQLRSQISEYDQRIAATAAEVGANAGRDPVLAQLRAERDQVAALLEDETRLYREAETERLAIGRDAREMDRAEREDAAAKVTANRRRQDQAAADDLRKSLDKDLVARQEWQKRREGIERLVAAGTLTAAEGDRLAVLALKERDEAVEKLTERTKGLTRAQKDASDLQDSWDSFWDAADKRSEERQAREADKRQRDAKQEQDKRERDQETALKRQGAEIQRTTDDVVRYGSDLFADMFATTEGSWNQTWENMGRTARGMLARIAAEAVIRPIVTPIVGGLLGATALSGPAGASGLGGSGAYGSLTNLLGLAGTGSSISNALGFGSLMPGGISGLLNTTIFGGEAASAAAGMAGASPNAVAGAAAGGTTLGQALGGVGLGFGAGTMLNSLVGGKSTGGMVGSGAGALAGVLAATMIGGPIGPILGGLLGGAGGGLLGGLFGANPASPASSVQIGIGPDGQLTIVGDRSKGMSSAEGIASTQSALASLNARVASSGLSLRASSGAVAQTHQGSDANAARDQEEITRVILSSLQGGSEAVMKVIAGEIAKGAAASLDQAFSDVDWVRTVYDPLTSTAPAISAFQQSLDALNKTYDDAERRAADLGLATTELAARQVQAIDDLYAARDRTYSLTGQGIYARQRAAMGDQMGADLITFDLQAQQQREALKVELDSLGIAGEAYAGQMRLLEDTLWWERKNIAERGAAEVLAAERSAAGSAANVIRSLADYSRSLAVGADSPLSAQDQFAAAQRQFNAVSSAALAGDANSLSSLQNYAQTYLSASRSLYGSTEGYAQAYTRVQDVLGQVGDVNADTLTASFYATQMQTQTTTLVQELQALRRAYDEQRIELRQLSSMQGRRLA